MLNTNMSKLNCNFRRLLQICKKIVRLHHDRFQILTENTWTWKNSPIKRSWSIHKIVHDLTCMNQITWKTTCTCCFHVFVRLRGGRHHVLPVQTHKNQNVFRKLVQLPRATNSTTQTGNIMRRVNASELENVGNCAGWQSQFRQSATPKAPHLCSTPHWPRGFPRTLKICGRNVIHPQSNLPTILFEKEPCNIFHMHNARTLLCG